MIQQKKEIPMKSRIAILTLAAVLAATPVLANEANVEAKAQHYLNKIDTNKDSQISKAEHDAFGDSMFSEADTNKDNQISLSELTAAKKKEKEEMKEVTNDASNNDADASKQ
jgi:hypothetical protein